MADLPHFTTGFFQDFALHRRRGVFSGTNAASGRDPEPTPFGAELHQ